MSLLGFVLLAGGAFSPTTRIYNSGTAATETVPVGAVSCRIRIWGPGAGAARGSLIGSPGAGAGGFSERTISVIGGNTFTYTVGLKGTGRTGSAGSGNAATGATSVTGTVSGGAVSMAANPGLPSTTASPGTGGAASGGTTNTTGGNGGPIGSAAGGNAPGPGGGTGGVMGNPGGNASAPGGGGGGTISPNQNGGDGADGRIEFYYT